MLKDLINIILRNLTLEELLILSPKSLVIKLYSFPHITLASENGEFYTVKYLFQNGIKATSDTINLAIKYKHLEVVEYLKSEGFN